MRHNPLVHLCTLACRSPLLCSVGVAVLVLGGGVLAGSASGQLTTLLAEWFRLQGLPNTAIGTWLAIIGACQPLTFLLASASVTAPTPRGMKIWRIIVVGAVTFFGSASLISLGFNGVGAGLVYLWSNCVFIVFLAGMATWHGIEILIACKAVAAAPLHVFVYSPAETKELRVLARHASTYAAVLTLGYAFTLLGTMLARWTGDPKHVQLVVGFWPVLYIPFCLLLLIYPQVQFRNLIRREKERLLSVCQNGIDDVLKKTDLTAEDVSRCNVLADLFNKVAATPEFVVDIGIIARYLWIVAANVAALLIPREWLEANVAEYLAWLS